MEMESTLYGQIIGFSSFHNFDNCSKLPQIPITFNVCKGICKLLTMLLTLSIFHRKKRSEKKNVSMIFTQVSEF